MELKILGNDVLDPGSWILDTGFWMLDAGQIMEDLIPMRRQDGGVFIGNVGSGFWIFNMSK